MHKIFLLLPFSLLFCSLTTHGANVQDFNQHYIEWAKHYRPLVDLPSQKNEKNAATIIDASLKTLRLLETWPKELPVSNELLTYAAKAIGQFSFFSCYTLSALEPIILPYLKSGKLGYEDLRAPHYQYQFGEKYARDSLDSNIITPMSNGQTIALTHHLNLPLYFNRLLSEFNGLSLLVGGGKKCECQSPNNHSPELFYTLDINNTVEPDLVAHAAYLPHLFYFPSERFSFIWFEHLTPAELFCDPKVFKQYFRMAKPGCIFLFQSNYLFGTMFHIRADGSKESHEEITKSYFDEFASTVSNYKFAILENKVCEIPFEGGTRRFIQLVVMKPYHAFDGSYFKVEDGVMYEINKTLLSHFRIPNEKEQTAALKRSKILSGQQSLEFAVSLEFIFSRLNIEIKNKDT